MNNLDKLGLDNWFNDKIDLSKTNDLQIARVISVNPQTPFTRRAKTAFNAQSLGKPSSFKCFLRHWSEVNTVGAGAVKCFQTKFITGCVVSSHSSFPIILS
jgi:hypothetical protein